MPRPVALLVVAAVLFAGLGSPAGGTHPDEGLYLEAAREMHDRGDWLTPTVDGRPDFTKPPLLYWAMAASFSLFGETFWAARLPVALAALALVWVTGRLARRTSGPSAEPVAILVLGTCLGLLRYGRVDLMDVPLALAIAVGLWACWRVADGAPMSLLLVTGLAAGAATLLKGPVGPLLMAAPGAAYLARRRLLVPALPWLASAVVLALLLAAPWYLAMAHRHGAPFVVRFFGTENVGKFRFPWTLEGEMGLLLALPVLLLPWTFQVRVRGPGAALAWPWVAGLLPSLQLARAEAPALRRAGARPPGGARERRSPGDGPARERGAPPRPGGGRHPGPALPPRRGCPSRARLRGGAARALGAGALPRLGARRRGGLRRRRGAPLRQRAPGGGSGARAGVGGGAGRVAPAVHRDAEPRALLVPPGRTVHRASGEGPMLRALEEGQALLVTRDERAGLPPAVTARLRPLATWPRLRGRLPIREVVNAWLPGGHERTVRANDSGGPGDPFSP